MRLLVTPIQPIPPFLCATDIPEEHRRKMVAHVINPNGGELPSIIKCCNYIVGWLAGYQACFDTQRNKLTKNNFALGFTASDFALHTAVYV